MYYVLLPISLLLKGLYFLFSNYGIAIIVFACIVKVALFPLNLKGKRSMIKMNLLNSRLQELQKNYGKDRQRYQMEVQKLYERENINPMGGCVWNLIPMVILFMLYYVIREPLTYMMHVVKDMLPIVAATVGIAQEGAYYEIQIAQALNDSSVMQAVQTALTNAGDTVARLFALNYNAFGLDLSTNPQWKFWEYGSWSWAYIGLFLIPILSAATGFLASLISTRTNRLNNSSSSNEQLNRQSKMMQNQMLILMPLMSLWIGFAMPAGLGIYWIANNCLMMIQEIVCGKLLRKDYERAAVAREESERLQKEQEKKRREERLAQKAKDAEEAKEAHKRGLTLAQYRHQLYGTPAPEPAGGGKQAAGKGGKKKMQAGKGKKVPTTETGRVGNRTYARGRSYDVHRYPVTPYHDPDEKEPQKVSAAPPMSENTAAEPQKPAEKTPEKAAVAEAENNNHPAEQASEQDKKEPNK